jgi:hypothetical protein
MLIDSSPPSKDNDWQTELKRKTWQSVVYKKHTLLTETSSGLGEGIEEDLPS